MAAAEELFEFYKKVRIGCRDCRGCFDCCQGMGNSIILDPFDFYRLEKGLSAGPKELLEKYAALNVNDGLILPNLRMEGEKEQCVFLNGEGRCGIHGFRPGLCRLFPLGRNYNEGKLSYFILEGACSGPGERTKVRIEEWIAEEPMERYESFLTDWHYFLKGIKEKTAALPAEAWESAVKTASVNILEKFYLTPYDWERDFYDQFYERFKSVSPEGSSVEAFEKGS